MTCNTVTRITFTPISMFDKKKNQFLVLPKSHLITCIGWDLLPAFQSGTRKKIFPNQENDITLTSSLKAAAMVVKRGKVIHGLLSWDLLTIINALSFKVKSI